MRRLLLSLFALGMLAVSVGTVHAQQGQMTTPPQQQVVLRPKLKLAQTKTIIGWIGNIEIRGSEVDAFLDTRKALQDAVDAATKSGKKDDDVITVDMRIDQANNLFMLMQRGALKGNEADAWKEIVSSIQDAAKAAQGGK